MAIFHFRTIFTVNCWVQKYRKMPRMVCYILFLLFCNKAFFSVWTNYPFSKSNLIVKWAIQGLVFSLFIRFQQFSVKANIFKWLDLTGVFWRLYLEGTATTTALLAMLSTYQSKWNFFTFSLSPMVLNHFDALLLLVVSSSIMSN